MLGDVKRYGFGDVTVAMKMAVLLGREAEEEGGLESEESVIVVTREKKCMSACTSKSRTSWTGSTQIPSET